MASRLEGITVLADDVQALADFFSRGLGLEIQVREHDYVALAGQGVRLAVFSRRLMAPNTHGHESFLRAKTGQAFELNFECESTTEVESVFEQIVAAGGTAIAHPTQMEWGHFTGFFADPEGNIHSLFCESPVL